MKNAELVLSELANRYGIKHKSADSAEDIGLKIAQHIDEQKPLELSEREAGLVKRDRETQLDMLFSEGFINKAQQDSLKAGFASEDLMLSEGDSLSPADRAFDTVVSVLRAGKPQDPSKERSGAQNERELELSEADQGKVNDENSAFKRSDREIAASKPA